jgi:hypothetical protein
MFALPPMPAVMETSVHHAAPDPALLPCCCWAEVEQLARRATLDVISRAAFRHNFKALEAVKAGTAASGASVDSIQAWDQLLGPAQLLGFNVPLPDSWIPGYEGYLKSIGIFEGAMMEVLQVSCRGGGGLAGSAIRPSVRPCGKLMVVAAAVVGSAVLLMCSKT